MEPRGAYGLQTVFAWLCVFRFFFLIISFFASWSLIGDTSSNRLTRLCPSHIEKIRNQVGILGSNQPRLLRFEPFFTIWLDTFMCSFFPFTFFILGHRRYN